MSLERTPGNLAHVNEGEAIIRADAVKLADYIDSLQPLFEVCSEAMNDTAVESCRDKAKIAGLPPPVTNLTFK